MTTLASEGKPRWVWYGICRDGLILSGRLEKFGVTGIWRWRQIFRRGSLLELKLQMAGALDSFVQQATAPSKNQLRRMRKRGQA